MYFNTYSTKLNGIDIKRIYANGASQGGAIAFVCSSLNLIIKKCACLYLFLSYYKRLWDIDLDVDEGIRYYFKWFDPMHKNEKSYLTKLGYIDIVNFADRHQCEVLIGTGLLDSISQPST